jgi:hypothetical protein
LSRRRSDLDRRRADLDHHAADRQRGRVCSGLEPWGACGQQRLGRRRDIRRAAHRLEQRRVMRRGRGRGHVLWRQLASRELAGLAHRLHVMNIASVRAGGDVRRCTLLVGASTLAS